MRIIELETPINTEKHYAPRTENEYPFYIPEYGKTSKGIPCYQLRMNSAVSCIQYVISGTGVIICDNKFYTLAAGDTFLLPAGSDQIYYSNPDNNFERIWLNFRGVLSEELLKIYGLDGAVIFRGVDTAGLLKEIQGICTACRSPEEYKNKTAQKFLELVQYLSENKKETYRPTEDIEQIRLFLDCNLLNKITLSDISERFSFTEEHIIRRFKATYGITPHKYILESKIRLAMIMLKTTSDTVCEIADKLDFSDSHHFSSQFKRIMGFSPSEYRKSYSSSEK